MKAINFEKVYSREPVSVKEVENAVEVIIRGKTGTKKSEMAWMLLKAIRKMPNMPIVIIKQVTTK